MNRYYENFKIEDGILRVHLSGEFPDELLQEDQNLFQPLIDACSRHHCKKALIDARELQAHFDTLSIFRSGEDAAYLARLGLRVALLAREDMINTFFDTVVFNRGGIVGVFTELNDAVDWLQK